MAASIADQRSMPSNPPESLPILEVLVTVEYTSSVNCLQFLLDLASPFLALPYFTGQGAHLLLQALELRVLLLNKQLLMQLRRWNHLFSCVVTGASRGICKAVALAFGKAGCKLKGEITYEVKDPAYCYSIKQVPIDFCSLSANLTRWLSEAERVKKDFGLLQRR